MIAPIETRLPCEICSTGTWFCGHSSYELDMIDKICERCENIRDGILLKLSMAIKIS